MSCLALPCYADTVGPNPVDVEAAMKGRYMQVDNNNADMRSPRLQQAEKRRSANVDSCKLADLSNLVAKAQALRSQLLIAVRRARVSRREQSAGRKYYTVLGWNITAFDDTTAVIENYNKKAGKPTWSANGYADTKGNNKLQISTLTSNDEEEEPASYPFGSLIQAGNWSEVNSLEEIRRRRSQLRAARHSTSVSPSRSRFHHSSLPSELNHEHQELPVDKYHHHLRRMTACDRLHENLSSDEDCRFQSLDQALGTLGSGGSPTNSIIRDSGSSTTRTSPEKLLGIIEQVLEEGDSSSDGGSSGMWEDPESALTCDEDDCPQCRAAAAQNQKDSGFDGDPSQGLRNNDDNHHHREIFLEQGSTSRRFIAAATSSSSSPEEFPGGRINSIDLIGRAYSSPSSSPVRGVSHHHHPHALAKVLEVPEERLLSTPPPPYVSSLGNDMT